MTSERIDPPFNCRETCPTCHGATVIFPPGWTLLGNPCPTCDMRGWVVVDA
jgi:DnaJ-class molecular chaperone